MTRQFTKRQIIMRIPGSKPSDSDNLDLLSAIDALSYADRIEIRECFADDVPTPRNLYFDYQKQIWF